MAHLRCDVFAESLGLSTSLTVLYPQEATGRIGMAGGTVDGDPPVLWLLHGLSDDDTTWVRRTSIERYAAALGLAVVMPQVHRSYYLDGVHTGDYWTWISEELPTLVHDMFRLSRRREDTFVAGLSMGGCGAMRLALHQPERFAAAASMSGALDVVRLHREEDRDRLWDAVLGGRDPAGSDDDLLAVLRAADPTGLPALHVSCGADDELLVDSTTFVEVAREVGADVTTTRVAGGHDWAVWDRLVQDVLAWLPLGASRDPLRARGRDTP